MSGAPEILEGEVVPENTERGLAIIKREAMALVPAAQMSELLERAAAQATVIADVLRKQRLITRIGNRDHIRFEGWVPVATANGKRLDTIEVHHEGTRGKEDFTALACVGLRDIDTNEVVAKAWASCSRREPNWKSRDDYAIESMAQTRAGGKVCRMVYGWVIALAGFEATPAEEMHESAPSAAAPTLARPKPTSGDAGGRRVDAAAVGAASHQSEPGHSSAPTPADVAPTNTRTANRTGWADEALATAKRQATHPIDTSGDMSVEQRANINDLRMKPENEAQVIKAQPLLKTWGYDKWSKFLVYGTALQAAEVEEILRGTP